MFLPFIFIASVLYFSASVSLALGRNKKGNDDVSTHLAIYGNNDTSAISNEVSVASREVPVLSIEVTRETKDSPGSTKAVEATEEVAVSPKKPKILTMIFQNPAEGVQNSNEAEYIPKAASQASKEASLTSKDIVELLDYRVMGPKYGSQVSKEAALIAEEAIQKSNNTTLASRVAKYTSPVFKETAHVTDKAPEPRDAAQVSMEAVTSKEVAQDTTKTYLISKKPTQDSKILKLKTIQVSKEMISMETAEL